MYLKYYNIFFIYFKIDKDNTLFFSYKNPHKCLFTYLVWNAFYQELIASDEQGRIYFINVQTDKQVQEYKLYDSRINFIHLVGFIIKFINIYIYIN